MAHRVAMIGAGSPGFSTAIARELVESEVVGGGVFVLMDIHKGRLRETERRVRAMAADAGARLTIETTTSQREALDGADYIVTSFAPKRVEFWIKDIEIAASHGVPLLHGENGGPAGCIHALRNITILKSICEDVRELCPNAWVMNFTNPMSMLCTYMVRHSGVNGLGFCHQVHGSFGVVAEMLGMAPGDLQVITAGINHMNFLLDIRKRGTAESCLDEFLAGVRKSKYWKQNFDNVPKQKFTLEFLDAFGIYPVGYDEHIAEYMPFFWTEDEWARHGYESHTKTLREVIAKLKRDGFKLVKPRTGKREGTIDQVEMDRLLGKGRFPFPADPAVEYYKESPVAVMEALATNTPHYMDAVVIQNNGSVSNLPAEAALDIPAVVVGGRARGIDCGEVPFFAAELCRRQIAIHELIAQAAVTGDRHLFLQALCLDPFVRGITCARKIMNDYLKAYRKYVPQFSG